MALAFVDKGLENLSTVIVDNSVDKIAVWLGVLGSDGICSLLPIFSPHYIYYIFQ